MAEDPTLITTILNMVVQGCQMNSGVFTTMGKGTAAFRAFDNTTLYIDLNDGTYSVHVAYVGPPPDEIEPQQPMVPPGSTAVFPPRPLPPAAAATTATPMPGAKPPA